MVALSLVVASAGLATAVPASAQAAGGKAASGHLSTPTVRGVPGATGTTAVVRFNLRNAADRRQIPTTAEMHLVAGRASYALGRDQLPGIAAGKRVRWRTQVKVPLSVPAGSYAVRVCLGKARTAHCRTSTRTLRIAPARLTTSPAAVAFGSTSAGASSPVRQVRVTNTGQARTGALTASVTGSSFALAATTCGTALAPGAYCITNVRFRPAASGRATGTLRVTGRTAAAVSVTLTGTGTPNTPTPPPPAVLSLSQSSYDFGYTDAPSTHQFTVTNLSVISLAVDVSSALTGDAAFTVTSSTCGTVLSSSSSCTVMVTYAGTGTAGQSARLAVAAPNSNTVSADLAGSPVALSITPAEHDFGSIEVGDTSQPTSFVLTNHRTTSVSIVKTTTGPFAVSAGCDGSTLAAGGTCTFSAVFTPAVGGAASGSVDYTAGNDTVGADLSGSGTTPAALELSASVTDLGAYAVGGDPGTTVVTVTNTGTASAVDLEVDLDSPDGGFAVTDGTCPAVLTGGASCTATVSFAPTSNGDQTAEVSVDGATGNTVTLEGLGAPAGVSLYPATYDYGSHPVGSSTTHTFRVVNTTATAEPIDSVSSALPFRLDLNADFSCVLSVSAIQPHRWCTISIAFRPESTGPFTKPLSSSGDNFNVSTTMTGTGTNDPLRTARRNLATAGTSNTWTLTRNGDGPAVVR